jgi:hypothetical protein
MKLSAKLQRLVERELDSLVKRAEHCVEVTIRDDSKKKKDTQDTQFRNLQNIAAATTSVFVLENFLRYQMGRGYVDEKVGERILQDIEDLKKRAEDIARKEGFAESEEFPTFRMELIRLYLGFLVRAIKAEAKQGESARGGRGGD